MDLKHINSENFESEVNSGKVTLVDFFATWCGPCKMLGPVLEQVADEVKDKVNIVKLDIDGSMDLAKQFGVMSVPTMVIFKDGKEVDRIVGLRQKAQIVEALKNI